MITLDFKMSENSNKFHYYLPETIIVDIFACKQYFNVVDGQSGDDFYSQNKIQIEKHVF